MLTLIQPISEAVEYHALLAGGNQADDSALDGGPVVDIILKYENLKKNSNKKRKYVFFRLGNEEGTITGDGNNNADQNTEVEL